MQVSWLWNVCAICIVAEFEANPSVKTLPRILIEVELTLDPKTKNADYFYGEVYGVLKKQDEKFGIRFECKYDEQLGAGMEQSILEGKIPYEYYDLSWKTFAGNPYQMIRRPLQFLAIDTTSSAVAPSFNYYNRTLFTSKYNEQTRAKAKNDFRTKLIEAFGSFCCKCRTELILKPALFNMGKKWWLVCNLLFAAHERQKRFYLHAFLNAFHQSEILNASSTAG